MSILCVVLHVSIICGLYVYHESYVSILCVILDVSIICGLSVYHESYVSIKCVRHLCDD